MADVTLRDEGFFQEITQAALSLLKLLDVGGNVRRPYPVES
jgi:hypothetical protein